MAKLSSPRRTTIREPDTIESGYSSLIMEVIIILEVTSVLGS